MNPQTVQATFGCLLHDVGKAVYRAGISDGRHGEAGYRFVRDIDGYGQAKAVLDNQSPNRQPPLMDRGSFVMSDPGGKLLNFLRKMLKSCGNFSRL